METLQVSSDAVTTPPSLGVDSFLVTIELLADSPLVAASLLLPSQLA